VPLAESTRRAVWHIRWEAASSEGWIMATGDSTDDFVRRYGG
jgi:hypothetical protein